MVFSDSSSWRMDDASIHKARKFREGHPSQSTSLLFPTQVQNSSKSLESTLSSGGRVSPLNSGRSLRSLSVANLLSQTPESPTLRSKSEELKPSPEDNSQPLGDCEPQLAMHSPILPQEDKSCPFSRNMHRRGLTGDLHPLSAENMSVDSAATADSKSPIGFPRAALTGVSRSPVGSPRAALTGVSRSPVGSPRAALTGVSRSPVGSPQAAIRSRSPPSSPRSPLSHFLVATKKKMTKLNLWSTASTDMDKSAQNCHGFRDFYEQIPCNIEPLSRIYYRYVADVAASLSLPTAFLFVWRFVPLVDAAFPFFDEFNHVRMCDCKFPFFLVCACLCVTIWTRKVHHLFQLLANGQRPQRPL